MAETPYMETEALLAVMNDDESNARRILNDFHDGELADFRAQLVTLLDMVEGKLVARGHRVRDA